MPVITLGLKTVWYHNLPEKNMEMIGKVKATYFGKEIYLLGLTTSHLGYTVARETVFLDDLRICL
jgi:hypothetical protein